MKNPALQRLQNTLLHILCNQSSRGDELYYHFINMERYFRKSGVTDQAILNYTLPYDSTFCLKVFLVDGQLNLTVTDGLETVRMGTHLTMRELHVLGEQISELLNKNHITLAPLPDKEFVSAIDQSTVGTIINLNNQTSIICTHATEDSKQFKRVFEGNLRDISIESFRKSDTYTINPSSPKDLHFLYGKAYTSLSNTADIRISDITYGQYKCTDIEAKLAKNQSKTISIGPLKLIAMKDSLGHTVWYDDTGEKLNRDQVGMILGWANNTIPEINTMYWVSENPEMGFLCPEEESIQNVSFLTSVKQAAMTKNFSLILEKAFELSKQSNQTTSLVIDDLVEQEDGSYFTTTYAFKTTPTGNRIYKLTYDEGQLSEWPETITEISQKEFLTFCEKKYTTKYYSLINKNSPTIHLLQEQGFSQAEAINKVISTIESRSDYNFLGITPERIKQVSENVDNLLQSLSSIDESEISFTDFVEEDTRSYIPPNITK